MSSSFFESVVKMNFGLSLVLALAFIGLCSGQSADFDIMSRYGRSALDGEAFGVDKADFDFLGRNGRSDFDFLGRNGRRKRNSVDDEEESFNRDVRDAFDFLGRNGKKKRNNFDFLNRNGKRNNFDFLNRNG